MPGFEPQLCYLLVLLLGASYLTPLPLFSQLYYRDFFFKVLSQRADVSDKGFDT